MAREQAPDYNYYLWLKEEKKKNAAYYADAKRLKDELAGGQAYHQYCCELLNKMSYSVGLSSKSWGGQDAQAYANTAREICAGLKEAERAYLEAMEGIMELCDRESERLGKLILEAEEEMDAWSKAQHVWNAGVLGKNDA